MGMTIADTVKELQKWRDRFAYDWGDYIIGDSGTKHALDTAVETIRKYQKIEQIVKAWNDMNSFDSMVQISEVTNE